MNLATGVRIAAAGGLAMSLAYTALAIVRVAAVVRHPEPAEPGRDEARRRIPRKGAQVADPSTMDHTPFVRIIKPLCGDEPELEQNLRSFCDQDYPCFDVIFALRDASDPAVAIAQRVVDGALNASLVIDPRVVGANRKISNVVHALRAGDNRQRRTADDGKSEIRSPDDIVIVADSDMRVTPDYLRAVVSAFDDASVGAVTCLYTGTPGTGVASILGAMHINEAFIPSVLVSLLLQPSSYYSGATMAVRRRALDKIGGFEALSDYLADDYMLGELVRRAGFDVTLAPYIVENIVSEPDLGSLFHHELRWARTIRAIQPGGYTFSVLTMVTIWGAAFLAAARFSIPGWIAFVAAITLRLALHAAVRQRLRPHRAPAPWWIGGSDILDFLVYCASHFGRRLLWRETRFSVSPDGQLHQEGLPR